MNALASVRIVSAGGDARLKWAEDMRFTLPRELLGRLGWLDLLQPSGDLVLPGGHGAEAPRVPGVPGVPGVDDARWLRERAAFTDRAPASAKLPFSYQRVPPSVRALLAAALGRLQRRRADKWAQFPAWPLDLSADLLADLAVSQRVAGTPPVPTCGQPVPVVLSHDIDSHEGLHNLRADFLPLEESFGARSVNFVVPCGWPLDTVALDDVAARGHELGIHGHDHSNRTPFADPDDRRRRLDAALPLAEQYGMQGYRSPSLLRTRALLRDLSSRYRYDSSIPTSGGLFPVPNNGCATARPFRIEGILEMPLTLPRDGSLRFLGHAADAIAGLWIECADRIARAGGIVMLLTHCERRFTGNPSMLRTYRRFLEYIAGDQKRFRFATPSTLLRDEVARSS